MTPRKRRDPRSPSIVRIPERELSRSILELAAPLLERLGPTPPPDEARRALELAIELWNARVAASESWARGHLRNALARWRKLFVLDPRFVSTWSFEASDRGRHQLVCEMALQLFAEGLLMPVGGAPVDIMLGGKKPSPMVLAQIRCSGRSGHNDVAVLIFRHANTNA